MTTTTTETTTARFGSAGAPRLDKLMEVLEETQLEAFWPKLRDQLQLTRLVHFDHVKIKDLESIGMSKPATRRLLDAVHRHKRKGGAAGSVGGGDAFNLGRILPSRPPPPPPSPLGAGSTASVRFNHDQQTRSRLYNSNITKTISKLNIVNKPRSNSITNSIQRFGEPSLSKFDTVSLAPSVSVIINPADISVLNDGILGQGNFGVVKKAIWTTHDNSKISVAVKCLHENLIDSGSNVPEQQQAFTDLINEISCMCGLQHANLIKLHGIVLSSGVNGTGGSMMMVTELAPYGSLLKYLLKKREEKTLLPLAKLFSYSYQVAAGMSYLEKKKLIHRDLAARNILLFSMDQIKICDFGMSRSVKNNQNGLYKMNESHKIPCAWYPPESIRHKVFSNKSDVWMFGVSIWEIFTMGDHPWLGLNVVQILENIERDRKRLPMPPMCSKQLYALLNECWSHEPQDRPSFHILVQLIRQIKIVEMKAKDDFKKEGKLEIERGDVVTIIEGTAANYWWSGQNQRTLRIGRFPRAILDPQRRLNGEDISMPLKNSFIHTGHMSAGDREKQWGSPGKIDEIFLRNPLIPPDLNDDLVSSSSVPAHSAPTDAAGGRDTEPDEPDLSDDVNLINLSDSAPAAEVRITYPDFSFEESTTTPSSSAKSKSVSPPPAPVSLLDFSLPAPRKTYYNDQYVPGAVIAGSVIKTTAGPATYYNNSNEFSLSSSASMSTTRPSSLGQSSGSSYYNNDAALSFATHVARPHDYQSSDAVALAPASFNLPKIKLNSTNPFSDEINGGLSHSSSDQAIKAASLQPSSSAFAMNPAGAKKFNFAETGQQQASSNHLDDFLSKVVNDVFNDLKKPGLSNAPNGSQIKC